MRTLTMLLACVILAGCATTPQALDSGTPRVNERDPYFNLVVMGAPIRQMLEVYDELIEETVKIDADVRGSVNLRMKRVPREKAVRQLETAFRERGIRLRKISATVMRASMARAGKN